MEGIRSVSASVASGLGTISAEWTTDEAGTLAARHFLPFGVTATFRPPAGDGSAFRYDGAEVSGMITMGPGAHEVRVPDAQLISPAVPSLP